MVLGGDELRVEHLVEHTFSVDRYINVDIRGWGERVECVSKANDQKAVDATGQRWKRPNGAPIPLATRGLSSSIDQSARGGMDACGHNKPRVNDSSTKRGSVDMSWV